MYVLFLNIQFSLTLSSRLLLASPPGVPLVSWNHVNRKQANGLENEIQATTSCAKESLYRAHSEQQDATTRSPLTPPNTQVFSFPYISEIVFVFQSGICLTSLTSSWLRSYSVANSLIWASLSFGVLLFRTNGLQDTP